MVCESMIEDQSEGSKNTHPGDQFTSAEDYAPKVRKPYTITKQRERWTEEEHKKFLEALKLYGRAWRRIEEHVGTKTAVQIRSHAQKFFSKVARESNSGDGVEVKPIEIPPPRPKRKPTHPYPRKLSAPQKTGAHGARSTSPNSSGSDQENQSPTSVLSAGGSNTFGLADSSSPNVESSPISSDDGVKPAGSSHFETDPSQPEDVPISLADENDGFSPVKLEACSEDKGITKEGSSEAASTQSLKLFGKTVLVTDSHRPTSPSNVGTCNEQILPGEDNNMVQLLPHNLMPMNVLPCGTPVYYVQFLDENSNSTVASSSAAPWWGLYGGLTCSFVQLNNPIIATNQGCSNEETKEKGTQNEGSLTGSNTGSRGSEVNWDVNIDTESSGVKEESSSKKPFLFRPSKRSAFTKQCRGSSNNNENKNNKDKCIKGFVPYKRCLAERNDHSSIVTDEEREEQRIRLCL